MRVRHLPRATLLAIALAGLLLFPALEVAADPESDASLTDALGHLGFNEYDAMMIIDRSLDLEDITSFRFAASLDPATITEDEAPWGIPQRIGVTWATWSDPATIPAFPDSPQVVDGALYIPHGGPLPDTSYALMWAQMNGAIPIEDPMDLFQNWSFPFGIPGAPTWVPLSAFPQDTWGGASVIPYVTYGPQPWGFFMSTVQQDGSLQDTDFTGFALIYNDTIIVAVDQQAIFPDGIDGITYSFAGHIHDGTFGSSPDSRSLVTYATGMPGDLVAVPATEAVVAGAGTAPETTTTQGTTTTSSSSSTSTTVATQGTPPQAGGETEAGGGLLWLLVIIALILLISGLWLWLWPRKPDSEDDDGDDPRDTPPPVVYGEVVERMQCDWAVYFEDKNRGLVLLRSPQVGMECCKYVIRVSTEVLLHEQEAQGRQDAGDDRFRVPDYDYAWDMVNFSAHASARSGPAGRLDWMQGYGDPIDQSQQSTDGDFVQRFQGEEPPAVATHLYHREETTVSVDLEAGCPEYHNQYEMAGTADLDMLVTQECTNDDPAPQCPVELMSAGWLYGRIGGDLDVEVLDEALGDIDDLERGSDQPHWYEMSHQHVDNLAQEKPTYPVSKSDSDSNVVTADSTTVTVYSSALADVGIIVPVRVWPTTERVSAHLEGSLEYGIDIDGVMTPKNCESNGCGGHGQCLCNPNFKLRITGGSATITIENKVHRIRRDPATANRENPPPTTDEEWVLV